MFVLQAYFDFQVFFEYFGLFYGIIFLIQKWVTGVAGVSCSLAAVSNVAAEWGSRKPMCVYLVRD